MALSHRLHKLEVAIRTRRREAFAFKCPVEWSRRFESYDPANAETVAKARALIAQHKFMALLEAHCHTGHLVLGLVMIMEDVQCKLAEATADELLMLTKAYQAKTGDIFPRIGFGINPDDERIARERRASGLCDIED